MIKNNKQQLLLIMEEAINAATINAAFAMDVSNQVGSITKGKKANFIITKPIHSYYQIPYEFGSFSWSMALPPIGNAAFVFSKLICNFFGSLVICFPNSNFEGSRNPRFQGFVLNVLFQIFLDRSW